MFDRSISPCLKKAASQFPAVALTGPRQSGKTTLLKTLFPEKEYVLLENPNTLSLIQEDPIGFIKMHQDNGIIFDEATKFPELFSYLQGIIDEGVEPGKFILSSSSNFLLMKQVSQSLAGRVSVLELLPLSYEEFSTYPDLPDCSVWDYLFRGSYPRPYHENLDSDLWFNSYIKTYLERDVRNLINIRDLQTFQRFLKLCAGRHGQILNLSQLAVDTGVSQTTVTDWLSVLEASFLIYRLRPYHQNFNKRVIKMPKLYFYDSGLVCNLLGIESAKHLSIHSARGAIFEGFIIAELIKHFFNQGKPSPVYFWRDHRGDEIDCIVDIADNIHAYEIKSTQTLNPKLFNTLQRWQTIAPNTRAFNLVYAGEPQKSFKNFPVYTWQSVTKSLSSQ